MTAFPKVDDRPYHLFTQEYEDLRASVRALLDRRVVARADELDRAGEFPRDVFEALGELEYLGLAFPEDSGGSDDPVAAAVVAEELGTTGLYGLAAAILDHQCAGLAIALAGDEPQRRRWLSDLLAGRTLWALALGEPHLDPDPGSTETIALRGAITGTKSFVPEADRYVVGARESERLALFIVDGAGVERDRQDVMGLGSCPVAELRLAGVAGERLPGDAREVLARIRRWRGLQEALALCGLARRSVETGIAYGLERHAFDRPVAKFQVWRHRWADTATEVEMARALAVQALRLFAHGEPADRAVGTARLYAGRVAFHAADECVQMHGGYGYMMEYPAQRFWRDARQATVVAGGDHVWLETIAREIGL